jgi:hypothetical protein
MMLLGLIDGSVQVTSDDEIHLAHTHTHSISARQATIIPRI